MCLSRCRRGRLGRRRRPSRDARRRRGAGARVTRRSRAAARGGGTGRGSRTREARYLRRCCVSNCLCSAGLRGAAARPRRSPRLVVERLGPFRRRAVALVHRAALLRRRRPPPQIVLRSAIFLIHDKTLRPPGRVRAPRAAWEGSGAWGDVLLRFSYSLEASGTRCARRAGGLIDSSTPTQPPQAEQTRGQNQQHIISGQESSSPRPATTRQRRRCGRRTQHRRGPLRRTQPVATSRF